MPIHTRRRLQSMLNDLGPWLTPDKVKDLLRRLEGKDTANTLGAEAELLLLWGLRQTGHLVIEPALPGTSSRIEAVAHHLLKSGPAAVEIRAISDDTFSGRDVMERTANIICARADQIRKKSGRHLYFEFGSGHVPDGARQKRVRFVDPDYAISAEHEAQLRDWLTAPDWPNPDHIVLRDEKTAVTISWRERVYSEGRVFCSMPPVTYDCEDNPLFNALKDKERQMGKIPAGFVRCIFIVDAGSNLLWSKRLFGGRETSAEDIVRHFLTRDRAKTDIVCLFSPRRDHQAFMGQRKPARWDVRFADRRSLQPGHAAIPPEEYDGLHMLAASLPPPRHEGYQARSLHRQRTFDPQGRGWYGGTTIRTKGGSLMSIEISARIVHELLAGRISPEEFKRYAFNDDGHNYFERELASGRTIKSVQLLSSGVDHDDDKLVFQLDHDAAAAPLQPPGPAHMRQRFDAFLSALLLRLKLAEIASRTKMDASIARLRSLSGRETR